MAVVTANCNPFSSFGCDIAHELGVSCSMYIVLRRLKSDPPDALRTFNSTGPSKIQRSFYVSIKIQREVAFCHCLLFSCARMAQPALLCLLVPLEYSLSGEAVSVPPDTPRRYCGLGSRPVIKPESQYSEPHRFLVPSARKRYIYTML